MYPFTYTLLKRPLAAALLLLSALLLQTTAPGDVEGATRDILKTTLDNGLTVILEEDHSAPVVAFQMWVNVGGADESPEEEGLAHLFEHMLFKGTKKRGLGEVARDIEGAGGSLNAYTSFDNTVYYNVVPSRHFSTGLDVLSDSIQNSAFDGDELDREIQVVLEEIRMNEDSPGRKLYKIIFEAAYRDHPYGRPILGTADSVSAITRKKVLNFFERWYIPNNMTLVIVGDFDKEERLSEIRESFKDFKAAPDPHTEKRQEGPQQGLRKMIIGKPIKETHMSLAFHIPELKHEDTYAVDLLSEILGSGASSRLYRRLKSKDDTVYSVYSYAMTPKEPGLFMITSKLKGENIKEAVKSIMEEISLLSAEGPTDEELDRGKINLESSFIYSRETMNGKAKQLGYYETISGDLSFEDKYTSRIRALRGEDVTAVLKRYLTVDNLTVGIITPDEELERVSSLDLEGAAMKGVGGVTTAETEEDGSETERGDITKTVLNNGITLLVKEVRTNPTVAFYATFPGGVRLEDEKSNGVGAFTAAMLTRGTKSMTKEVLEETVEGMAGSISGFSGRNSTGVTGKFLSRDFSKGLAILGDVLQNPSFPLKEVEKVRKDTFAAIEREEDYLPGYTFKLLYKKLYSTHPYSMTTIGTKRSVAAIGVRDLKRHHRRVFAPGRMVLTIVGDISHEEALGEVSTVLGGFRNKGKTLKAPESGGPIKEVHRTGAEKDKAQTNIGIGFKGVTIKDDDRFPLEILSNVLAGQSGRLFLELRDKRSLAYSLSSFSRPGVDPGIFGLYIATAPDKADAAITGLLEELEKIREVELDGGELDRAKRSLIGGYEIGLQSVSSQAADIANNELFGLGYDFSERYGEMVEAVTAKEVLEAAKRYLTLDAYVISTVGIGGGMDASEGGGGNDKGR